MPSPKSGSQSQKKISAKIFFYSVANMFKFGLCKRFFITLSEVRELTLSPNAVQNLAFEQKYHDYIGITHPGAQISGKFELFMIFGEL